jgi:hypothetical protein
MGMENAGLVAAFPESVSMALIVWKGVKSKQCFVGGCKGKGMLTE